MVNVLVVLMWDQKKNIFDSTCETFRNVSDTNAHTVIQGQYCIKQWKHLKEYVRYRNKDDVRMGDIHKKIGI